MINTSVDEAKKYILSRVSVEIRGQVLLGEYLIQAASRIIEISYKYRVKPSNFKFSANRSLESEVNEVISWLKIVIVNCIEACSAMAGVEDKEFILRRLHRIVADKTLRERTAIYSNRYKYELEAFVAAGLMFNLSEGKLLSEVSKSLKQPYSNPLIQKAITNKNMNATRLMTGGVKYGTGKYTSSANNLIRLERFSVADAWMWINFESMIRKGFKYYRIYRGSSYPCSLCDSLVGYHRIEEGLLIPAHGHCCCIQVPAFDFNI